MLPDPRLEAAPQFGSANCFEAPDITLNDFVLYAASHGARMATDSCLDKEFTGSI